MTSAVSKLLRLASVTICLIVAASFVAFAVNQTSTASGQQQEVLNPKAPSASGAPPASATQREGGFRKKLDEASETLTSPVSSLTSPSSEWGSRALRLIFALLFYGFALGYLARVLRVRA